MHALFATVIALTGITTVVPAIAASPQGAKIESRFADANGLKMHYLVAGAGGSTVILLHGYAQNSHMWRPLMSELGKTHRVIAPDLRGFGDSAKPEKGYDKTTVADIAAAAQVSTVSTTATENS